MDTLTKKTLKHFGKNMLLLALVCGWCWVSMITIFTPTIYGLIILISPAVIAGIWAIWVQSAEDAK